MKILILHQAPFKKMRYDRVIDHHQQQVVYIGLAKHLDDLPAELPCKKIVLPPAAEHNLVAEVLARVNADDDYTSLLALSEYGILEACEIRAALGLSGPSYEQIARVRDKVKMKQRIAARGTLRYPRFIASPLQIAQAGWHGKTITKPRDGASSQGVILHQDFLTAVAYLEEKSGWENHELEEFIDAPLYHFDGVVINGEVQHLLASRYINSPLAYLDGVPVGSFQVALKDTFRQFINEVIAALGIVRGCFHIEAFYDGETCIFLEAANRLGGARIVETHQLKTGVHLPSEEISDLLGLPHQQHSSASQQFFGFLLYPSHFLNETGKLIIPEEIKESSHLISFQRGEVDASEVTYNEDRLPLSLVASADTPDQLHSFLTRCLAEITIN
ncbi:ATP-grasp domain-containing protein [Pantoea anthophila]|uniref:ATP-grasp domain-containing protein n=1 Tax=Pantoea anthophila TaxID=470931 RepID=UPI003CED7845